MIKPTVGRVVWYWPFGDQSEDPSAQPLSAQIAYVFNDTLINIGYLRASGSPDNATSVPLYQGEGPRPRTPFCEWMPYQKGQAQRTEQAEKLAQQAGGNLGAEHGFSA